MTITEQLAHEAKQQLLKALQGLPDDAPLDERLRLITEASRLLERAENKTTQIKHIGD